MSNLLEADWEKLLDRLAEVVGKKPADLNAILFLVGLQELGKGARRFSKEQKQDLMHVGTCVLLSQVGYYQFERRDEDGWPHWKLVRSLPAVDLAGQEDLLKQQALVYFSEQLPG